VLTFIVSLLAACAPVALDGHALTGGPRDLCIVQTLPVELEPARTQVAMLVMAPQGDDARLRRRLFVYERDGDRLVPRFLGSGFTDLDLLELRQAQPGSLRVAARASDGSALLLDCRFVGFPLVCTTGDSP
jgi:hypothetical protein